MRIDSLSYSNVSTQGAQRRQWLKEYAPQHLEQCRQVIMQGLQLRSASTSRSTAVLGAGACTEVPLAEIVRASDEVILVDLDLVALLRGRDELTVASQRKRVRLVQGDISGQVSSSLQKLVKDLPWSALRKEGGTALFEAVARCLDRCPVPDPPMLETLEPGSCGLVVSSLILSQLFSYPLLDVLDAIQNAAPELLLEQERHRRYQEAAQAFRLRVIHAHLHLLKSLLDQGGIAVLLTDIRGFVFQVIGTDHDARHRKVLPLVPRAFTELVHENFAVVEERQWEWISDLPDKDRPGRGYEVMAYITR